MGGWRPADWPGRHDQEVEARQDGESAEDLILPGSPFRFPYRQVREQPDCCGFRLVRQINAEFGPREEAVPREYDRKTAWLVLPE